jgi:branched-chain amino acid transport system ATP-binding protein
MMLEVDSINTYYGTSHVLFDVSLNVNRGEVVCLLGRNGAGKTTTIRSIMGLTYPRSGRIHFEGVDLQRAPPYDRARRGMGFVPDDRRIFPTLTVRDNLELGAKSLRHDSREPWDIERIYALFTDLRRLDGRKAGQLSGGEQQMLSIARTLMGNPVLLLMDEPAEGLAPLVVKALVAQVGTLKELGQTILLSEQNLPFALGVSDRAYVIEKGTICYQGSIEQLKADEEVKRKYLMV